MLELEIFTCNLKALEKKDPLLSFQLQMLPAYQHAKQQEKIPQLNLRGVQTLFVYGIMSQAHQDIKNWLKQSHDNRLIFLEDEIESLQRFLQEEEALDIIENPQVSICYFRDKKEECLKQEIWTAPFGEMQFFSSKSKQLKASKDLQALLVHLKRGIQLTISLYQDFGVKHLSNLFENLLSVPKVYLGEKLKNRLKGVPAVICGAGPSLDDQVPVLKNLLHQALIIVGGSAIEPFNRHKIPFHFGAGIDPDPPKNRYLGREKLSCPIFYQNVTSPGWVASFQGEKVLWGKEVYFPLETWIDETLGLNLPSFDGGWTVANFMTHVAYYLGCDPIIFMGMDFAVSREKDYAQGVSPHPRKQENPIVCQNIKKEDVHTRSDFLMAKEWIETFHQKYPDVEMINVTEKGLLFEGITNLSLSQLMEEKKIFSTPHKMQLSTLFQEGEAVSIDLKHVQRVRMSIKKSFQNSLNICEQLLERIEENLQKGVELSKESCALLDVELSEEVVFQKLLNPLWYVWKNLLIKPTSGQEIFEETIQEILFYKRVTQEHLMRIDGISK